MPHTPGPWTLEIDDSVGGWKGREGVLLHLRAPSVQLALMCNENYYPWTPDNIDDWHLIAAAPDLLIACKAALNDRMFKDWPEIATLLINAIAKAEGPHE